MGYLWQTKRMIDSDGEDDKDMFLDDEVRPIPAPPIAAKAKPAPVKVSILYCIYVVSNIYATFFVDSNTEMNMSVAKEEGY